QEPLPCVVVTLGRNEQGEFPNRIVRDSPGTTYCPETRSSISSADGEPSPLRARRKDATRNSWIVLLFACCGGNNLCWSSSSFLDGPRSLRLQHDGTQQLFVHNRPWANQNVVSNQRQNSLDLWCGRILTLMEGTG